MSTSTATGGVCTYTSACWWEVTFVWCSLRSRELSRFSVASEPSKSTLKMAAKSTSSIGAKYMTAISASEMTAKSTSAVGARYISATEPKSTSEMAAKSTSGMAADSTSSVTPGSTSKITANSTSEFAAQSTVEMKPESVVEITVESPAEGFEIEADGTDSAEKSTLEKTESIVGKTRSAVESKPVSTTEVKEAYSSVKVQSKALLEDTDGPGYTVEVLYPAKATIGEGVFYEEETKQLLWVDVYPKTVNFLNINTGENRAIECPDSVSAVIPVEGSENILVMVQNKMCLIDRHSGEVIKELCSVEEDKPNRINDCKCDSCGRLWFGTMARKPVYGEESGAGLYCYSKHVLKKFNNAILSNGIGWSPTNDKMYHVDSHAKSVYIYSYNKGTGTVTDRQQLVDYSCDDSLAVPDGMCTDEDGRLWVASYGGKQVTCWDPNSGEVVKTIMIPGAKDITTCCFGGPNYEWLFVASATSHLTEEEREAFPNSGSLFVVKNLGTRGTPAQKFKL